MKKYHVFVFPCGSGIGLEIYNSLKNVKQIRLFGGSSVSSNHGKYIFQNYIEGLPNVSDPDFIKELNKIVEKELIDFIFPAHDSVALKLSQSAAQLKCTVVGSPASTNEICRSKRKTYIVMNQYVKVPRVFTAIDEVTEFPVFLKPDVGQGARGTHIVHTREELAFHMKQNPDLLMLEYLPGEEYTVDCFTNRHGQLLFANARCRERTSGGISTDTYSVDDGQEQFMEWAKKINSILEFRGGWFFQLKRDLEGNLTLLEMAPRVSGSMGLTRNMGVNIPLLSIFDLAGHEVTVHRNTHALRMDRALINRFRHEHVYNHVYIDFDDTLVLDEKVNVEAVKLIYQCINKGIKSHLISRHKGELTHTLRKYRLLELFDSIIHITDDTPKSAYIPHRDAIFIDDSHKERMEVHTATGIPVFDVSAIESLLDWRR